MGETSCSEGRQIQKMLLLAWGGETQKMTFAERWDIAILYALYNITTKQKINLPNVIFLPNRKYVWHFVSKLVHIGDIFNDTEVYKSQLGNSILSLLSIFLNL